MITVKSMAAGIFRPFTDIGANVRRGEVIAHILDPLDCSVLSEIVAPCDGMVFFMQFKSLAYANAALFRIIANE